MVNAGQLVDGRVPGMVLQHALYGHIHLQQQRPLAVLAYQTLYPEKSANAAALSNRIDLVQAGAGIEHGAARRQFDLMTAKGVLNDQFASGIDRKSVV